MSPGRQRDPLWEMTRQKSWGVSWSYHISLNKRKPAWRLHPLDACICFCSFSDAAGLGFNQVTMPSVFSELLVVFFFPAASSVFVSKSVVSPPWDTCLFGHDCWVIPANHTAVRCCLHKFTPDWSRWLFIDPYEFGGAASKTGCGKIQN